MANVRLSPYVAVLTAGSAVIIRSDLKSFALSGESVKEFVTGALPLLDGHHSVDAIIEAFPSYSAESVRKLLADLERLGVVETVDDGISPAAGTSASLAAYLRYWEPNRAQPIHASIPGAHIGVIGSTSWGAAAAAELVRSGVGRLTVLAVPSADRGPQDALSAAELVSQLRTIGSSTRLATHEAAVTNGILDAPPNDLDLLLVTAGIDELALLGAIARMAEKERIRYLLAHVDGMNAMVGPVVIPGETPCWECLRQRQLVNQANFEESAALQAGLLSGEAGGRLSLIPPGLVSLIGGLVVSEAVRLVSGYAPSQLVGRQLAFNSVTWAAKMHGFVRLPWCPVCGGAGPMGGRGPTDDSQGRSRDLSTSRDPVDFRANLGGWLSDRSGVVRQLFINDPTPDQPHSVKTATAVIAGPAVPHHHADDPLIGSGKGTTAVAAMVGAVGEAIERYSASVYRESDLLRASAQKLGGDAFDPVALCLYLPEQYEEPQFPFARFDPVQELSWAEAAWLDSGRPVLVPALVTFFDYLAPKGERFCQVTSSGLAAGRDFSDAALRATMELIERDAFMTTWLQHRPPKRVAIGDELGADVCEVLSELAELGMETHLYLMNGDVKIPSFMCIAWGNGTKRPAATVALAAHTDPVEAARKAILEQAHVGPYVGRLMADVTQTIPRRPLDVRSLNDHALYYVPRRRLKAFDFIRSSRSTVSLSRLSAHSRAGANATDTCVTALADAGFRIAVADVTSPDVRLGPFRVARALGTYLQPIDFGYRNRRLANPRLAKGRRGINPDPHPLA